MLQVTEDLNCGHDEELDNATLRPNAFASKNLSSVKWWYSALNGKH